MIVEKNLETMLVRQDETVRVGLERLNATPYLMQLVVDQDGVLVGTMTDGDVRRGLLKGFGLEAAIAQFMNRNPRTARNEREAVVALADLKSQRPCIPLLDGTRSPIAVVAAKQGKSERQVALIMAGGFGRRLGKVTENLPKPLVPINGRPILGHLVERLSEQGFDKIFVSVHHLRQQIIDYVGNLSSPAQISLVEEAEPLGTAGALGLLPEGTDGPVLTLNGDVLTQADLPAMMQFHKLTRNDLTIAAARYEFEIPFGVLRYSASGELEHIDEKPRESYFVSAGIYIVEASVRALLEPNARCDMPELIASAKASGLKVGVFPLHEYWIDVGRPEDIGIAEADHRQWAAQ